MERRVPARMLEEAAALAAIREHARRSTMTTTRDAQEDPKAVARRVWALGDYHRFARQTVWEVGARLVEACAVAEGDRVLDVAAGSGNVALQAAERGAKVVASDLTPENLEAGRSEAEARGLELEWVEADAEALPFGDGEFDAVLSSFGAMFAPDHRAVAGEMLRVCRPGGTIGMANFRPEGAAPEFFGLLAAYSPPSPPGALSPLLWGTEEHVRELFGDRVSSLKLEQSEYTERVTGAPADYVAFFKETFGPVIAVYESSAGAPERVAALDRDFLDFATRRDRGPSGGPAEYPYEYLLVVARKRGG